MLTPAKFAASVCFAAGIFVAGYLAHRQPAPVVPSAANQQVLYYTCPMHPQYRSDHPGTAPCCGMRLVAVDAGDASRPLGAGADAARVVEAGTARQQLVGIRTREVRRAPVSDLLRVPGRIAVDENRLYRIIAASEGWIRALGPNAAGTFVRKGQLLGSYYAPNFQAAQQALLFNMTTTDLRKGEAVVAAQRVPVALNLQIAIDTLRGLGMSDRQIEDIQRTRQYAPEILIYAPITGFVLARGVSPAQRFDRGFEMYRMADLDHVWVLTDVFEKDRQFIRPGATATVRYQGLALPARMSDALPQLDPQTRTLKTRLELDNPGHILAPDAFVEVELPVAMPAAVTVPADAVIDTGRQKTVYVERGSGIFEPRLIETGWRIRDRVQVIQGLEEGERIVVSGNFLIDSESRMNAPLLHPAEIAEQARAKDPVCGMDVDAKAPGAIKAQHGGKTYSFCSAGCRKRFEANPEKYLPEGFGQSAISGGTLPPSRGAI